MATDNLNTLATVNKGVQLAAEAFVPGASNLVKGDYGSAALYALMGLVAKAVFGVPGILLVSANSYTKARTGRSMLEHLSYAEGAQPASKK